MKLLFQVLDGLLAQYGTVENVEQGNSEEISLLNFERNVTCYFL